MRRILSCMIRVVGHFQSLTHGSGVHLVPWFRVCKPYGFWGDSWGIGFHEDGYPNSWMEFISEHPFNMDEWGRRLIQIPKVVRSDPIGSDSPQSCAVWSYQNMMSIGSSEAQKDLSTKCLGKHQFCFSPLRVPDNTQLTEEPK